MTPVASRPATTVPLAILAGLGWFAILIGACMALFMINARTSPGLPWFPLPALALCVGSSVFAERRWKIGLSHPPGVDWARVYVLGFATMIAGACVAILQGAAYDMTLGPETGPEGTSESFRLAFAFTLPLVVAILAEVAYRGIMQGRIHVALSPVATILVVSAVNTASHRWNAELLAQWLGYFVLLAGVGWVRWLGGSIVPPLVIHSVQNLAVAVATWYAGPFPLGELPATTLAVVAAIGVVALVLTLIAARGFQPAAAARNAR